MPKNKMLRKAFVHKKAEASEHKVSNISKLFKTN